MNHLPKPLQAPWRCLPCAFVSTLVYHGMKHRSQGLGPSIATASSRVPTALVYSSSTPSSIRSEGVDAHLAASVDFKLDVLYEDEHIVAVNKPSGMLCVPGVYMKDSLSIRVGKHCGHEDVARVARMVVHRLDQATSGVVVFARNELALKNLHAQFREKEKESVQKRYVALVDGRVQQELGQASARIRKDMDNPPKQMVDEQLGKPSLTRWRVIAHGRDSTLMDLFPITGRTHQLRVHMAAMGHAIMGDTLYADEEVQARSSRLCLHAEELRILHPATGERMRFVCHAPEEWMSGLETRVQR